MKNFKDLFKESLDSHWEKLAHILPEIIAAVLVFSILILFAVLVRKLLRRTMNQKMEDKLLGNFLSNIIYWVIILIGLSISLKIAGFGGIASGIVAGAGVSAFIIGFAFKDIGENFLAGILMAFSRPFRVGDTVEINGVTGNVQSLDLRNTHIKTPDGKDVYIPNGSVVKNNLFNFTIDGFMRREFILGIDQDDDYNKAMKVVLNTVSSVPGVLQGAKKPVAVISGTDSNSVLIKVFYWTDTFDKKIPFHQIQSQTLGGSIKSLVNEGFYLPNTIIELKNYKGSNFSAKAVSQ